IAGREGRRVAEVVAQDDRVVVLLAEAVRSEVVPVIPHWWPAQDVGAPVTGKRRIVVRRAAGEAERQRAPGLVGLDPRQLESAQKVVHHTALVAEALSIP